MLMNQPTHEWAKTWSQTICTSGLCPYTTGQHRTLNGWKTTILFISLTVHIVLAVRYKESWIQIPNHRWRLRVILQYSVDQRASEVTYRDLQRPWFKRTTYDLVRGHSFAVAEVQRPHFESATTIAVPRDDSGSATSSPRCYMFPKKD